MVITNMLVDHFPTQHNKPFILLGRHQKEKEYHIVQLYSGEILVNNSSLRNGVAKLRVKIPIKLVRKYWLAKY